MSSSQAQKPRADILVVDDTPANLNLLAKMLSERGYRVRPVPNGKLALTASQLEPPNLILLDIKMPEMDGYSVCQQLKEDIKTHDIPVIFISAMDATQDKIKAFHAGGQDYITKPFHIEEVLARVETHLALRELQRKLQETNAKMEIELALAGEVQASFLPKEIPEIRGWQLAVDLQPSRETSGDFYDINLLPNGLIGILVADVVDKGAGAALFMAMSWSLLRTYAEQYPEHPELVLSTVNRRILEDTDANLFVTVFYCILDPKNGNLVYCNAGHCPPLLIDSTEGGKIKLLTRTGVPLGIFQDQTWTQASARIGPGDLFVLYSDGITEAHNAKKEFFGEAGMYKVLIENRGETAQNIQKAILAELNRFMGSEPQTDDIVLAVILRE